MAGHNLLAQIAALDMGCSQSVGVDGLKTAKQNKKKQSTKIGGIKK